MLKSTSRLVRLVAALCLVAVLSLSPSAADAGNFGSHKGHGQSSFHGGNHGHQNFGHNFNFRRNFGNFQGHNFHKSFINRNFGSGFHKFSK